MSNQISRHQTIRMRLPHPALVKIQRDLEYRLPESGRPLKNIVLTREQAAELLAYV
jgi:hypothetical protein